MEFVKSLVKASLHSRGIVQEGTILKMTSRCCGAFEVPEDEDWHEFLICGLCGNVSKGVKVGKNSYYCNEIDLNRVNEHVPQEWARAVLEDANIEVEVKW